jgi:penicillin-binding protein 2
MNRPVRAGRMVFLVLFTIALIAVYVTTLYKLQIIEGTAYYERSQNSIVTTETVTAARGNILDRYGRVLVSNRTCNNLVINTDELFDEAQVPDPNAVILQMVEMVTEYGDTYTDTLPITRTAPFEFVDNMTDIQRARLDAYVQNIRAYYDEDFPEDPSAVELMAFFRDRYQIDPNCTAEQTRIIAGVRYELNIRYIIDTSDYVFAEDVSIDLITTLMEWDVPGVEVTVSYIREYKTSYAAHILGYVGMMDELEYASYQSDGYPLNALVGKDGVEKQFESYLHGADGEAKITSTAAGTVTGTVYTKEPEPGNHVQLTIDIGLQEAAEQALASFITATNGEREIANAQAEQYGNNKDIRELITGGAVVAIDIKTGEPLCIASYPTFDLATFLEDFAALSADEAAPMFNRALNGAYAPGSTFKPVTALACLDQEIITVNTTTKCEGIFTKYEWAGYTPTCWIYGQGLHGDLNVTGAIKNSCNYFFYTWGDLLGIDRLEQYARRFGLGESTGIELPESTGNMSNQRNHEELVGQPWYNGDTLQASIGQADSLFTPLQLANYAATLANGGTRYEASMLKSVRSYDYSEKLFERTPTVADTVYMDESYYDAVHLGMKQVGSDLASTVGQIFATANYTVAAKTGTAQLGEDRTNNAAFICFAPADDPQVAVAVVVEKGYAGSAVTPIAKEVLDYYFSFQDSTETMEKELSLLK